MGLSLEAFLGSWHHLLRYLAVAVRLPVTLYILLTHFTISLLYASPTIHSVGQTSLLRHSLAPIAGAGISACFPSTTPLGLALGPDLPRADQLYPGNLGYSAIRILTLFSLLIPAFSLPCSPQLLTVLLRPACNAPLPIISDSLVSVARFSPGHFRRRTSRPVSYYALFE